MARPEVEGKKERCNITVRPMLKAMAGETPNASRVFEQAVDTCLGVLGLLKDSQKGKITSASALAKIEDRVQQWAEQLEVSRTFVAMHARVKKGGNVGRHAG